MNPRDSELGSAVVANDLVSRSHVQTLVLMGATAVGLHLCYRLARPFLAALAWALALAVVFSPFQRWIESKVKHANLAAVLAVLVIGLGLLGLATFVGQRLVQEAANGAELIKTKVESGAWRRALEAQPRLVPLADWVERQNLPGTVKTVATWLTTAGSSTLRATDLLLP
jgi:predicted PurR-regulated permease PerM